MRSPRSPLLLLLVPIGSFVAGFGGCGVALEGESSTVSGTVAVSASGSGGAGGGYGTGIGGSAGGELAATCTSDSECGGDLSCVLPTEVDPIFGGGAPRGFCTRSCTDDTDCGEDHGVCYKADPTQPGRCTLSCTIGPAIPGVPAPSTQLSAAKCRGRSDVRCALSSTGAGVCLPTCGEDAQCQGGYCDPGTALCAATPSTGEPTGTPCDVNETPSACAGVCVGFETPVTICTEPCVLGDPPLQSANCGGPTEGLCAFHPSPNGAGDTGFCTPSCVRQSDCHNPTFWCFGVPAITAQLHNGYCFAATACPNGQADCDALPDGGVEDAGLEELDAGAGDAGPTTCTETPLGAFCLDPAFPVDLDAGAGDGGGDAGDAAP